MHTTEAPQQQGLSPRTHALITGYKVAEPPIAEEQDGLSPDMCALIHRYVDTFRARGSK